MASANELAHVRLTPILWSAAPHWAPLPLLPYLQEPGAEELARKVSAVLNSKLRDVEGENTLHHDVDALFEEMFDLAAEAGLLVYQSDRNTGDTLSGTTGQCKL